MPAIRRLFKLVLAALLHYSGMLSLLAAVRLRDKAVVLMYHRVLPASEAARSHSTPSIVVSPRTFAAHLRFIRRRFRPMSAAELAHRVAAGKPIPTRTCVVTFDDGWYDNHDFALPIIAAEKVPTTIYVATNYIGQPHGFWQERVAALLAAARAVPDHSRELFGQISATDLFGLDDTAARTAIRRLIDDFKTRDAAFPHELADSLTRVLTLAGQPGDTPGPDRFMSWDQVRRLQECEFVDVGSHCMSHTPLTKLPEAEAERELRESRQRIAEQHIGTPATIAYPNGDFSEAVTSLARGCGYQGAFTTVHGWVSQGAAPHALNRINIHEAAAQTVAMFHARILGVF